MTLWQQVALLGGIAAAFFFMWGFFGAAGEDAYYALRGRR